MKAVQATTMLGRAMRLALAVLLVMTTCVPPAYASYHATGIDSTESGNLPAEATASASFVTTGSVNAVVDRVRSELVAQAVGIDLNAAWKAQENGLSSSYTIDRGGTYYLSGDLAASARLVVNAPEQAVTLKLNGHALTLNGGGAAAQKTMLAVTAAKSFAIDGAASSGVSAIKSAGNEDVRAISLTASKCATTMSNLTVQLTSNSTQQRNLQTHCVYVSAGSLKMTDCKISMNMGNQQLRNSSVVASSTEAPSAVYASAGASSVQLANCSVDSIGTPAFSVSDLSNDTTRGNVYALYSLASNTTVSGGNYKAESLRGNATCIYGKSLTVSPNASKLSLKANAGQLATGILSKAVSSVKLNASFSFDVDSLYSGEALAEAALRSTISVAPGGFVFGDCASSKAYPTLVMPGDSLAAANIAGFHIGAFDSSLPASKRSAVLAKISDALGSEGSCSPVFQGSAGICFKLDTAKAAAQIVETGTCYSTAGEALAAAKAGQTVKLLKNVGTVAISSIANVTVDLNGHSVSSVDFSCSLHEKGVTLKNGFVRGTQQVDRRQIAVYHHSASPLVLEGVQIEAAECDADVYGMYAESSAGKVSIGSSSRIDVTAMRSSKSGGAAYGIGMATSQAPQLEIDNSSISVRTPSAEVAVFGVQSFANASISDSSLIAEGATGSAYALYGGGKLEAHGSSFDAFTTSDEANPVGAVGLSSSVKAESVILDSCELTLGSPDSAGNADVRGRACVLAATDDTDTSFSSLNLTLSGGCAFKSASGAHLGNNLGSIRLGPGFGLDGGDMPLRVSQTQQTGDVGFIADGSLAVSDALATSVAAVEGSYYEGWKLVADDAAKRLVWRPGGYDAAQGLVSVNGAIPGYASLRDALAHASSGDTLALLADLAESGSQLVDERNLTLDLQGHTLTLRGGAQAGAGDDGSGGALKFTGTGTLALRDSSSGKRGKLVVQVGTSLEPSEGAVYQGIVVSGGGTFKVDEGTSVEVGYVGGSASTASRMSSVEFRGISVVSGSLDFKGKLDVSSAPSDGAAGPMAAYGVFSEPAAGKTASIDVAHGSSITVNGRSSVIATANSYSADSTSTQVSAAGLREITLDSKVDADFYADVVRQFRISATYDDPSDTSQRDALGTYVYYAQPMVLDHAGKWYDGLCVWAFSDEVTGSAVGKMSSITPSHVFLSTGYDALPSAYGIATGGNTSGKANVVVDGAVAVNCSHGNAYALDAQCATGGVASWTCDGASVSTSADTAVHPVAQKEFDLRDFVKFSKSSQDGRVAYSTTASAQCVDYRAAVARNATVGKGVTLSLNGKKVSETATAQQAADAKYKLLYKDDTFKVPVSFTNVFNDEGALQDTASATAEVEYGKTLGEAKVQAPEPADYADESSGLVHRFIGWYPYVSGVATNVLYSSAQLKDLKVTTDIESVSSAGKLVLRAAYVVTSPSQHIVSFEVDNTTSVCVVDDGAHPLYTDANNSREGYISPSKLDLEAGKTYEFAGWFADANSNGLADSGEAVYAGILPAVHADARYRASWTSKWATFSYTFYTKSVSSSGEFFNPGTKNVAATGDKSIQDLADSVSPIGTQVGYGGKLYTLLGWSNRSSDVEPIFDARNALPSVGEASRWSGSAYSKTLSTPFYGVYSADDHVVDVTFKDEGATLGSARVLSVKTVNAAFAQTGAKKPADKSEKLKFLGWAVSAGSDTAIEGAVATIDDVAGATASTLTLHSVYGDPPVYTVRLRGEDGLTSIGTISVKSGSSVNAALAEAGKKLSIPVKEGKYFSGWRTASGERFDLDSPVTGSADLYASYSDIEVITDSSDVSAVVSSTSPQLEGAESVRFELTGCRQPQTAISTTMSTNSYSALAHYNLRVYAVSSDGTEKVITGDFGTAAISIKVGKKYKKSTVRAFWTGEEKGTDTLKISAGKTPDSKGIVKINVGNYTVGDDSEGGNFSTGYIEGGAGGGLLGTRLGGLTAKGLAGASLSALTPNSLSGSLSNGLAKNGGSSKLSSSSNDSGAQAGGENEGDEAQEDALSEFFAGWGSEAFALIALIALLAAVALYGLWRLIVVRQRREEAEAEFVTMSDRYAEGIMF